LDQWGNIVNGVELGRRIDQRNLFGLTTPLITTASGAKMGKTAAGAVWLNPDLLSSYDYWQYWRNTDDADVGKFLRLFTDLPMSQVQRLESLEGAEINEAKKILATEATKLCRGEADALAAAETARRTFEEAALGDSLPSLDVERGKLDAGLPAFELFRMVGFAASNGEARRLIKGGGARINDMPISEETRKITSADLIDGVIKLSAGKKRHALIRAA
jgi:tyrosyl-tRNA synthetase